MMTRFGIAFGVLIGGSATVLAGGVSRLGIQPTTDGLVTFDSELGYSVEDQSDRIRADNSGPNSVRDGVFEFDLSVLPADAQILGANLQITTADVITAPGMQAHVFYFGFAADGQIGGDDHRDNTPGVYLADERYDAGPAGVPAGVQLTVAFNDIAPLQAVLDDGRFFGVRIQATEGVVLDVHSIESALADARPVLNVSYVPEPAALLLLVGGTALLRRRG